MNDVSHPGEPSPWFLALPWMCRQCGALIVAVLMLTLWTSLLIFHVIWWVILLTIIIPAIPLASWLLYWSLQPVIIPAAGNQQTGCASVRMDV